MTKGSILLYVLAFTHFYGDLLSHLKNENVETKQSTDTDIHIHTPSELSRPSVRQTNATVF